MNKEEQLQAAALKVINKFADNITETNTAIDDFKFNDLAKAIVDFVKSEAAKDYWQGWVSVEERLPTEIDADENGKVLIYRVMNEGQRSLSKSIFDWWMVKNCDKDTHWQPLSSQPKKVTNDKK